ncbi:hypothetical protein J2X19_004536 [Rhodoferax ferrireducens]|uniref:Uncharacterized protein n=1 Tax=Rhodoferax ferrireducens TaxID=192843 RepID=A0ABU2CER4_9BURK|nr:hypothetical protein [Rhodoferax ferrireducens]MDR7379840.1 hypothetical protein [Rhodoferax ferrireducens]
MPTSQRISYDRGFRTLFEDGVYLLLASEKEQDNDTANSLARGSIACTMMLPEVAANICIESLNLEPNVFKDIDKLSPLAKFDFFLRTNFRQKKLPTGVLSVQKAQELKRLRDTFVHPKKQAVIWTNAGYETEEGISERTQFLDMSKNPSVWDALDAERALRGAHEFLALFFRGLCGYTQRRTTTLLFSDEPNLASSEGGTYYYHLPFRHALKRWKVDTSYFRIGAL